MKVKDNVRGKRIVKSKEYMGTDVKIKKSMKFITKENEYSIMTDPFGREFSTITVSIDQIYNQCDVKELDRVNVRRHHEDMLKKNPGKGILDSLKKEPDYFNLMNNGITIVAGKHIVSHKRNSDEIGHCVFCTKASGEYPIHGVIDGMTTLTAIVFFVKEVMDKKLEIDVSNIYVSLRVIVGVKNREELVKIAIARNTYAKVNDWSIDNFKHKYDDIKEVLAPWKDIISYSQNGKKEMPDGELEKYPYNIKDILKIIDPFHPDYGIGDRQLKSPKMSLTNGGRIPAKYVNEKTRYGYEQLYKIIPKILEIRDYIEHSFIQWYEDTESLIGDDYIDLFELRKKNGKAVFPGKKKLPLDKQKKLNFSKYISNIPSKKGINNCCVVPFLASLRCLLKEDRNGNLKFEIDPILFLKDNGKFMIMEFFKYFKKHQYDTTSISKDTDMFKEMYTRTLSFKEKYAKG